MVLCIINVSELIHSEEWKPLTIYFTAENVLVLARYAKKRGV